MYIVQLLVENLFLKKMFVLHWESLLWISKTKLNKISFVYKISLIFPFLTLGLGIRHWFSVLLGWRPSANLKYNFRTLVFTAPNALVKPDPPPPSAVSPNHFYQNQIPIYKNSCGPHSIIQPFEKLCPVTDGYVSWDSILPFSIPFLPCLNVSKKVGWTFHLVFMALCACFKMPANQTPFWKLSRRSWGRSWWTFQKNLFFAMTKGK